jgi:hypothetical protein
MKRICRALAFSSGVILLVVVPSLALSRTIYVDLANKSGEEDGSPSHPFATVTRGYGAAVAGDTLIVRAGNYPVGQEGIKLDKAITVRSEGGTALIQGLPAPFDLVWEALDPNGLPANPGWGYYVTRTPTDPPLADPYQCPFVVTAPPDGRIRVEHPPCTTQPVWWEPGGTVCDFHVNWQTVEYDGPLFWDTADGHSCGICDDDYNFWLGVHPRLNALTTVSRQVYHLEFKASETIDRFHTPWWEAFHTAVDDGRGTVVDTDYAIVIGLLGLDHYHSPETEIHPVYAMAIHDDARRAPDDDVWAIFVRNWGNEGFCSSDSGTNTVSMTSISFKIPWRSGATSVTVRPSSECRAPAGQNTQFCTNSEQTTWNWNPLANNEGVLVTFTLPRFDEVNLRGARINGELHLQWAGSILRDPCASPRARLIALQDALNQLYKSIPGNKAENPSVAEAAERRVEAWHRTNDREVAQLRQQLRACQIRAGLSSAVPLRVAPPAEERTPELRLQESFAKLSSGKQQAALARIKELESVSEINETPRQRPAPVMTREPIRDTFISNPMTKENDRRRKEILCSAFDNNVPGFPDICR